MAYRFGIDAGSKTIKVVVLDETGAIVHSLYHRHRSDIKTTLKESLHELVWRYGDMRGTLGITGSAGIGVASMLNLPFVQEVVATTHAVQAKYPQADAIIELGGEDAKVVYLTGGLEQRMNATCAGGTGGFIDTIAYMIGSRSNKINTLAMGATRIYPIASRCAVFAQTDVRPLLNAGAKPADIAASALEAVVRQTLSGLACGRPIQGTVVFLGGPLEHISSLTQRFRNALGLNHRTGIKPPDAHLFTACGAALYAAENGAPEVSLAQLEAAVANMDSPENDLVRLAPLFGGSDELAAFKERHAQARFPRSRLSAKAEPLYVGVDAGSTTVKLVAVNDEGALVYSDYEPTDGDAFKTASAMLEKFYTALPKTTRRVPYATIRHATVTGYGEELLKAGLGIDSGVVETLAHVRAAQAFRPDLTFLLDIGGQDMKAIWLRDGRVANAVLNEACSSGCGSFIEGTAYSLRTTPYRFAEEALQAKSPVDLGTKCTVFMTSRVRHAQKIGVERADIAAGIAYSVVRNALFRIIGMSKLDSLGTCVMVQGGAFKSDAVLRAFELVSGLQAVRPDCAHLMGAIGAALTARMRAQNQPEARSALIALEELRGLSPKRRAARCPGCENNCALSLVDFGNGKLFISGNRCDRAAEYMEGVAVSSSSSAKRPPNAVELEQKLLARFACTECSGTRGEARIGLMNVLSLYEQTPYWHTLLCELGFSVIVPDDARARENGAEREGVGTIPSESVCYPAKIAHTRLYDAVKSGALGVFMPRYSRGFGCPVMCEYGDALADSAPVLRKGDCLAIAPTLSSAKLSAIEAGNENGKLLLDALNAFAEEAGVPAVCQDEWERAVKAAQEAQCAFEAAVAQANERALAWVREQPLRRGVMLAGRPYHVDPALLHGIDHALADVGFAVLSAFPASREAACEAQEKSLVVDTAGQWRQAKRLVRLARYVARHPELEMVCLQSFGCLFDAVSLAFARDILEAAGHPFTVLKIDDMADTAHIRIRLRTLAETLELVDWRQQNEGEGREGKAAGKRAGACADGLQGRAESLERAVVPFEGALQQADIDEAQSSVNNDVCFVVKALAGKAIRAVRENPGIEVIEMPAVCERCLVDAVPALIRQATGASPRIEWSRAWPEAVPSSRIESDEDCAQGSELSRRPRVGIIGCALLCYDGFMNDYLVDFIESQGCEAVLPRPEALFTDDVRYLDELERFAREGVDHVIYLQSFGCLKGHVHARGALHELARRFPSMPVTVLDYDPEASALNRENRIRLALAAAKKAAKQ